MQETKNKILIVDDEKDILDIYAVKFETEGFEVLKEDKGQNVFEIAKKEKPDLILLDIMMDGSDGYSIIKALKSDNDTRDIPVIMFSNLGQRENIEEGITHGAEDYIPKANFTPEEVVRRVKKVLKNN